MNIKQKIGLLADAAVISANVRQAVFQVIEKLQQWQLDLQREQLQMLLTHLAMALQRAERQQQLDNGLEPALFQEVQQSANYHSLLARHRQLLALTGQTLNAAEQSFLIANLHALSLDQPHLLSIPDTEK
ncbi:PRD domain-containing protein [Pasteurella testudinis DSM 23072]|uniref:PRD domain-containing protein n=1 Tax=Pasteurella testudinis DSM 23072 TaxID=1122938 RepID=A0A1W1UGB4_9PAST|nr:PRD domain-containing protein [Pasteurella testudinis]SMB80127.1 PRD domain-containing protein [Pasteurella testudinis DSM 23072]SUB50592.1 PRD domain-containing protein [Pasteurella testudinis]